MLFSRQCWSKACMLKLMRGWHVPCKNSEGWRVAGHMTLFLVKKRSLARRECADTAHLDVAEAVSFRDVWYLSKRERTTLCTLLGQAPRLPFCDEMGVVYDRAVFLNLNFILPFNTTRDPLHNNIIDLRYSW
jgi:hypothetical protein